jgi:hypothetical protein
VFIGQQQMRIIQIVTLLVLPGLAIASGIVAWRRRKH